MDKRLKVKWVAALRSGEYPQGRRSLGNRKNGYCCLGVLCIVAGHSFRSHSYFPSKSFVKSIRLPNSIMADLANKNDGGVRHAGKPWSFRRIATWIEKHL